ncbi:hypothetical protein Taro_036972, partial [Colocasia esculenta]|nr:hypothetical protein [Colocasia esculenta]
MESSATEQAPCSVPFDQNGLSNLFSSLRRLQRLRSTRPTIKWCVNYRAPQWAPQRLTPRQGRQLAHPFWRNTQTFADVRAVEVQLDFKSQLHLWFWVVGIAYFSSSGVHLVRLIFGEDVGSGHLLSAPASFSSGLRGGFASLPPLTSMALVGPPLSSSSTAYVSSVVTVSPVVMLLV